jgi:pimeloyl-ACP methyl ester carboxylesterase
MSLRRERPSAQKELGGRARLIELPGVGHMQPLEAPEPVAHAVTMFVERVLRQMT